jgi:hypothetical protein
MEKLKQATQNLSKKIISSPKYQEIINKIPTVILDRDFNLKKGVPASWINVKTQFHDHGEDIFLYNPENNDMMVLWWNEKNKNKNDTILYK